MPADALLHFHSCGVAHLWAAITDQMIQTGPCDEVVSGLAEWLAALFFLACVHRIVPYMLLNSRVKPVGKNVCMWMYFACVSVCVCVFWDSTLCTTPKCSFLLPFVDLFYRIISRHTSDGISFSFFGGFYSHDIVPQKSLNTVIWRQCLCCDFSLCLLIKRSLREKELKLVHVHLCRKCCELQKEQLKKWQSDILTMSCQVTCPPWLKY